MLTLKNFEEQVNTIILQRGEEYYENGAVIEIKVSGNNWVAKVEGNETYTTVITLQNNNKIIDYECGCPFEGDICKHVAATLFTIRDEINTMADNRKNGGKNFNFGDLLKKINLEEYREFAAFYASKNQDFKTAFELFFSGKDERIDVSRKYAGLVNKIIRKYSHRGFIDYMKTFALSNDIEQLLDTGHDLVRKNNFKDAFLIVTLVLKDMMDVITYCDDSAGCIGGVLDSAIRLTEVIAKNDKTSVELKAQIFDFLRIELNNNSYFEYGNFGYDMFPSFQQLAIDQGKASQFIDFLDTKLSTLKGEYDEYKRSFFHRQKIEVLNATGKTEEANMLVLQHLDIVEVRQGEVNKAIARKDFPVAKKLIADGISIAAEKKHPGTVSDWQKELLCIAVLEEDIGVIRHYAKHFAFDRWFDAAYYRQWKQTFAAHEWKEVIEKHIAEMQRSVAQQHLLALICIEEEYWDRLLALAQKENNLDTIMNYYHEYLAKGYPADLIEIYLSAFRLKADKASDRNGYADLVKKMKKVMKDIPEGKEKIRSLAGELKNKYARRPAMIDELNKIERLPEKELNSN